MRRLALYGSVAIVLLSLIVTVLWLTTYRPASPRCTFCGAPDARVRISSSLATWYHCPACGNDFSGPPRGDISWTQAAETWLDQTGVTPVHYPRLGTE
jgi:hypothetical protein